MGSSQQQQPASKAPYGKPFAVAKQPAAAAVPDSLRMMDQRMASPEPATPASITSETRGAPAAAAGGPPLTTLASLSKLSGGGASDHSGTVTPLTNMHASHVPLSSYNSGSPEPAVTAAAAAAGKKASKLVWGDILLWKQPLQTATIFVSGLAAFGLLNFAAYGAHKMTLMSGGCLWVCCLGSGGQACCTSRGAVQGQPNRRSLTAAQGLLASHAVGTPPSCDTARVYNTMWAHACTCGRGLCSAPALPTPVCLHLP
jgi:hypothetical protein